VARRGPDYKGVHLLSAAVLRGGKRTGLSMEQFCEEMLRRDRSVPREALEAIYAQWQRAEQHVPTQPAGPRVPVILRPRGADEEDLDDAQHASSEAKTAEGEPSTPPDSAEVVYRAGAPSRAERRRMAEAVARALPSRVVDQLLEEIGPVGGILRVLSPSFSCIELVARPSDAEPVT
jgi:hypothetical protein